jgi:hypothetical protein
MIWLARGALGNQWYQGIAPYQANGLHQIFIKGTRGRNVEANIVSF